MPVAVAVNYGPDQMHSSKEWKHKFYSNRRSNHSIVESWKFQRPFAHNHAHPSSWLLVGKYIPADLCPLRCLHRAGIRHSVPRGMALVCMAWWYPCTSSWGRTASQIWPRITLTSNWWVDKISISEEYSTTHNLFLAWLLSSELKQPVQFQRV